MIRILLADDHEFVRRGLRTLLELNPELQVVGEAADGGEAAELAMELAPDVVLMDLFMPGIDGTVGTQRIRQRLPGTEVIALTSVLEGTSVIRAMQSGAIACVLKDTRAVELLQAIKSAAAGHVQLNPKLAERLIREIKLADHATIDPGDRRVLLMIAEGWTNAMMAAELGIDERAMRTSTDRLLRKIGALSRTQAALYAVRTGIIALDQVGAGSPDLLHRFDSGETGLHSYCKSRLQLNETPLQPRSIKQIVDQTPQPIQASGSVFAVMDVVASSLAQGAWAHHVEATLQRRNVIAQVVRNDGDVLACRRA